MENILVPYVSSEQVACAGCRRTFSAAMGVCPFCGQRKDSVIGSNVSAATPPQPPPDIPAFRGIPVLPPDTPPAPPRAVAPACVKCGASSDLTKVRIERWEDKGFTFTGKQKYRVQWVNAPAYCRVCSMGLLKRRLTAHILTALPIALLAPIALAAGQGRFVPLAAIFFYTIYLIRWGGYTWADKVVYGYELESMLSAWIPAPESGEARGKIRFPGGCLHALLRLVFAFVLSFLALGAASALGLGR